MLAYLALYLGGMLFVQEHYNYDWTPAILDYTSPQTLRGYLINEGVPTSLADPSIQDSGKKQALSLSVKEAPLSTEEKSNLLTLAPLPGPSVNSQENSIEINSAQENTLQNPQQEQVSTQQEQVSTGTQINAELQKTLALEEELAAHDLVDIETLSIPVFLDIKYATYNNFTGQKLYEQAKCYLKKPAAQALAKAAAYALQSNEPFYLCIYDCYRPKSVQQIMLDSENTQGYLASVSNHSRGMAVDLGPCDDRGEPFLTPTEFDTFSEFSAAYTNDEEIPKIAIKNRTDLQEVMKKAGFSTISNEWWHFDYKDAKNEEVLDIKF